MKTKEGMSLYIVAALGLALSPGCFFGSESLSPDAYEPNDTAETATSITLPFDDVNLTIDSGSDVDFYRFALAEEAPVRVVTAFVDDDGDIDITLREDGGGTVGSSSGTSDMEIIERTLSAGTYVLEVRTFGSTANRYDLSID